MDIYEDFMALLEAAIEREGNAVNLAKVVGITSNLITRWRARSREPRLSNIQPVLDYWGAKLVWPGSQQQCGDTDADTSKGAVSKSTDLESTIAKLQAELAETRSERDMARGEVRALERQLARMMPTPEHLSEKTSPSSSRETRGSSVKAG